MLKGYSRKKIIHLFSAITLTILSMQAQAMPNSLLPSGWKAHTPIHLRSPLATLQPSGMSPAQIKQAYGFPAIYQGSGEVIAIVDAYDDPDIETDLNTFSKKFGLPACTTANGCFTKLYASGTQPQGDSGWGEEMSLDVEWAHAIAPAAKILLKVYMTRCK
jgi:subtilase family serine protease